MNQVKINNDIYANINNIEDNEIILKYNDELLNIEIVDGEIKIEDLYKLFRAFNKYNYDNEIQDRFFDIFYNNCVKYNIDITIINEDKESKYNKKNIFKIYIDKYIGTIYFECIITYKKILFYYLGNEIIKSKNYYSFYENDILLPEKVLLEAIDFYSTNPYYQKKIINFISIPITSDHDSGYISKYDFAELKNIALNISEWYIKRINEYKLDI